MPARADGADRPLVNNETTDTEVGDKSDYESAPTSKSIELATTDDEVDSTARLSRRSSVLVDILSLFRRSSSALVRHNTMSNKFMSAGEEEDEDDMDDARNMTKDRILAAIQQKKEIIGKLRSQPWNMKRKRRTLKVAQRHLQRQEAKVSKVRLYKAEAGRRISQISRWFDNFKIYLIPWEAKIKRIESHYGSVVSSYFTFLRWTLGVNITMTCIMLLFVIIPEWLADSRMLVGSERYNRTASIKVMPVEVRKRADEISTIWDFGGYMEYSLMFYGFYSRETFFGETVRYRVPVAYFLVNLFVLGYSFFTILRKMASNARNSKLSNGKTEQYVFNWKSFTGWDFTIGNSETAGNVHMANVIKFREAIAEYTQNQQKGWSWIRLCFRIFANLLILSMFVFSVWAIITVNSIKEPVTFIEQNAVSITVSLITLIFPNIFELIGKMERYHPRTTLRWQLARVLVLYIVNYYTLIASLMMKLNTLESERDQIENSLKMAMENEILHHTNVTVARTLRQALGLPSPTPHSYFSYVKVTTPPPILSLSSLLLPTNPSPTVPAAPSPWTTVFSDFGPIGISNPRVVVSPDRQHLNESLIVTQVIGPNLDWNSSTTKLNLSMPTLSGRTTYTQPFSMHKFHANMCWETVIGQEISKLITMDLIVTIAAILVIDFLRGLFCRYCNLWWCWNLEKTFPEYGEFKVAENVLHLVNNQGMIWLGLFFVPMLPALNNVKLIILMYVRSWAVMTCNVPARQIFRASRSSNFYLTFLLLMLFLCTLPVGYVIASRTPSRHCGPFGNQPHFYSVILDVLHENLNRSLVEAIKYSMSPGIIIPVLVLLLLVIYFLFALIRGLREANNDLTTQLMHERTEEKKKIFEMAGGTKKKREFRFTRNKKKELPPVQPEKEDKRKAAVFTSGPVSSDEDTQLHRVASPQNKNPSMKTFVPSLGSVSEVDHSDGADEQEDEMEMVPVKKRSIKQRILGCIGWSEPKKYEDVLDLGEMEEGRKGSSGPDEEQEEESDYTRKDSERNFLLPPPKRNGNSRERSTSNRSIRSEDRRSRDASSRSSMRDYRTPSLQGSSKHSDDAKQPDIELSDRAPSRSTSFRSQPLETEFIVPKTQLYLEPEGTARRTFSALSYTEDSDSFSHTGSLPVDSGMQRRDLQDTARRLLQPISTTHTTLYGPPPTAASAEQTRPPSADGSLSDPSPAADSTFNNSNPHSSYTSAMMSPIMNDMLSTDEGTDDEKARLLPDKPPHGSWTSRRTATEPPVPRAPRFRISMSPPRKRGSDPERRFEMRVGESSGRPRRTEMKTSETNEKDEIQTTV